MDLRNTNPSSNSSQDREYEDFNEQSSLWGKLNPSLLSLKHLYYLDLSGNDFQGIEIPKFFGQLKGPQVSQSLLYLICGRDSSSFGNLSNLNYLDLSRNELSSRNLNFLSHVTSIKYLNLGGLDVGSSRVSWLHVINMLPSLSELHLSNCQISENLPLSLKSINFTSLLVLDMSQNDIESSFPSWFFNLTSLRKLDLSSNSFSGPIPREFASLKSLEHLDLSSNRLENELPTFLGMLPNLRYLNLASNSFWGSIPESIGNLSSLKVLSLRFNGMNGSIPESLGQLSQLIDLDLYTNSWKCTLTEAHFLNLTMLESFAVSTNQSMYMSHIFNVPFRESFEWYYPTLHMQHAKLVHPFLEKQSIIWRIPSSMECVARNTVHRCRKQQSVWKIPCSMGAPSSLKMLVMNNNSFGGDIPSCLQNCNLETIDLEGNNFSGGLPLWIGSDESPLRVLQLRSNFLSGHIPQQLCDLSQLHILDLAHNNLSGTIPKCPSNLTSLTNGISNFSRTSRYSYISYTTVTLGGRAYQYDSVSLELVRSFDLSSNNLEGEIPEEISSLIGLGILNLSMNHLSGTISSEIGNLLHLEFLDLSHNHLSGQIPSSLFVLSFLVYLDLSHNNLSGRIPSSLFVLSFLVYLDLSHNNLSGRIPFEFQLQTFDSSTYAGNPLLCGDPLSTLCPGENPSPPCGFPLAGPTNPAWSNEGEDDTAVLCFSVSIILGFIVGFWGVCGTLIVKRSWRDSYFRFFDNIKDKVALSIALKVAHWQRTSQA
ncbi:hypothetical protein M0R45_014091 [Rubus argutus]|uniref:Disease resistance R13L4/SHOC-2-like LRR domain-containing protein n=1 Tax=Rubus argutus TaxID=59490 RepID=A0AAW1XKE9_RUBAR